MHGESTSGQDGRAQEYAQMIKPGDAVETPDGSLWVVECQTATGYALVSAYRGATDGAVYRDRENEVVTTIVPAAHVTKVCDARQVRRS